MRRSRRATLWIIQTDLAAPPVHEQEKPHQIEPPRYHLPRLVTYYTGGCRLRSLLLFENSDAGK